MAIAPAAFSSSVRSPAAGWARSSRVATTRLGRDLAVKVLLEKHRDDADLARRFIEEAQIGGQLQHPGIVPIYELGAFADRRPYFAMKLVKGRTLASLLDERTDPVRDLPRFLSIFESDLPDDGLRTRSRGHSP